MTDKRKKLRSEEVAIRTEQDEAAYQTMIDECKKLLDLKGKELAVTKKQVINRVGKFLEHKHYPLDKISAKIKRDFKDYFSRFDMWSYSDQRWRDQTHNNNPSGSNQFRAGARSNADKNVPEQLSQQDQEYVQAHKDEYERTIIVDRLIELWTGKNSAAQGEIIQKTPKSKDWRKQLLEDSKEHMQTIAARMTDTYVNGTLNDMRMISMVATAFGDILYEERQSRERKAKMASV